MTAVQVTQFEEITSFSEHISVNIGHANDHLLYRRFEECLNICLKCIKECKNYTENTEVSNLQENLVLLAIQAYAELNRWQEVLPFISDLYKGIEDCPKQVAQLCILLHAEVNDWPTCSAIANIWLRNPANFERSDYSELVEVYVSSILIANHHWEEIEGFLSACGGLPSERVDAYMHHVRSLQAQWQQQQAEVIQELPDEQNSTNKQEKTSSKLKKNALDHSHSSLVKQYILKVCSWSRDNVPLVGMSVIQNISIVAAILYIIFTRYNIDLFSSQTWSRLWQFFVSFWRSMFSPIHSLRK